MIFVEDIIPSAMGQKGVLKITKTVRKFDSILQMPRLSFIIDDPPRFVNKK